MNNEYNENHILRRIGEKELYKNEERTEFGEIDSIDVALEYAGIGFGMLDGFEEFD